MLHLLLFTTILTVATRAADDDNHFTNPSSWTGINPEWKLGEEQVIAWETTLEVFNISFWQQSLFQQTAASQGNVYCTRCHDIPSLTLLLEHTNH
jgi:hypothetical protein